MDGARAHPGVQDISPVAAAFAERLEHRAKSPSVETDYFKRHPVMARAALAGAEGRRSETIRSELNPG